MANQDSFIDEVNEEVRRDRFTAMARRYGWIAIVFVVLLVGGAAFNEYRKANIRSENEARGDRVFAAISAETAEGRAAELELVETGENPDMQAVVALLQAGADSMAGNADLAVEALDGTIDQAQATEIYRDMLVLKSVIAGSEIQSPDQRIAALQPLIIPGAPFRLLALEQIAFAEFELGRNDVALSHFETIAGDASATQGLQSRAAQMSVILGGDS